MNEIVESIVNKEITIINDSVPDSKSLSCLIKFHYDILKELSTFDDTRQFAMAPLASTSQQFVEFNIDALKRIYSNNLSKSSKLNENQLLELTRLEKPNNISDLFDHDKLRLKNRLKRGFNYSPTFRTNGVVCQIIWEKEVVLSKSYTREEYEQKKQAEIKYKKNKEEKIKKQIEEKGKADVRTTRKQYPKFLKTTQLKQSKDSRPISLRMQFIRMNDFSLRSCRVAN